MSCLKCGRSAEYPQVFCEECLADMEKNPVKPGTPIYIPAQPAMLVQKKPKAKVVEPEEQIRRMRVSLRWMRFSLAVLLAALGVTIWLNIQLLNQRDEAPVKQHYTVVDTTSAS